MRQSRQLLREAVDHELQELEPLDEALATEMCESALAMMHSNVRGGDSDTFFERPFCDAPFSDNVFSWDTCFIACFAKHSLDELPIYQSLDYFYELMDEEGFVCREYWSDGTPVWPKTHSVSINPPLLAFAEQQLFDVSGDLERLETVFPHLERCFEYHVRSLMHEDGLFHGDALGSGMDNIRRHPPDWKAPAGSGLEHEDVVNRVNGTCAGGQQEWIRIFVKEYLRSKQAIYAESSRLVDLSAQMALFAKNMSHFSALLGFNGKSSSYELFRQSVGNALNPRCWNEALGFYCDLGEGAQIPRKHIGMYWMLLADLVPEQRLEPFISHLLNPECFYRTVPLSALSADDPDFRGWGGYWCGGVWPPTVYMVLCGLREQREERLAYLLARKIHQAVAKVYRATGTFWENYAPDLVSYGMPAKRDCSWSAILPICLYREFIQCVE